ncbi:hypothetical protein LB452_05710 [Psychroflexus sp. CAK8W]|uniref:Uncharacterized protein n=1 Tax=Psychroflexus longus TaxID=2873596 RepID=A0ABS7XKP0_9FLAO|nr:hypothetical protein [Psychroflexus longus]MBZ9778416.1 hypothetical protein [Psychroflexus longus]
MTKTNKTRLIFAGISAFVYALLMTGFYVLKGDGFQFEAFMFHFIFSILIMGFLSKYIVKRDSKN